MRDAALKQSGLVYISPLRADGSESTCHGEVWFAWLDGSVVIITGRDRWKARAVARGLDGARLWVGDHGPWKRLGVVSIEIRPESGGDLIAQATASYAIPQKR